MKKQSLLLVTAGLLAAASCNTDTGNADEAQAKIDSIVNARVDEIRLELQAKNDSIINELAMWRADSILNAMKGKKVKRKPKPKPKPQMITTTTTTTTSTGVGTAKPATVGNGKPKMGNQNSNTVGNGKPKMGNKDQNAVGNGKPKMGNK